MAHERIVFDEANHTYTVNDRVYPGVTSILHDVGLTPDFSKVPEQVLEYKRTLGQELHKVIELELNDDLGDYDPVLESYVTAWRRFRDDYKITPIATELPIFSATYGACGKLDLLAEYSGNKEGLFDFKSCLSVHLASVGPQLAGYDLLYREWTGQLKRKPYERFAVKLMKDGNYKLIKCDNLNDLNIFLYAVQLWHWKNSIKHPTG